MFCFYRYNPNNLKTLERYIIVQSQENMYDLAANLAVLKLYQFNQGYDLEITSQILLKALTNLPHTDFVLCKCLLNEELVSIQILSAFVISIKRFLIMTIVHHITDCYPQLLNGHAS